MFTTFTSARRAPRHGWTASKYAAGMHVIYGVHESPAVVVRICGYSARRCG